MALITTLAAAAVAGICLALVLAPERQTQGLRGFDFSRAKKREGGPEHTV